MTKQTPEEDLFKEYDLMVKREDRIATVAVTSILLVVVIACALFYGLACAGMGMTVCTG